MGKIKYMNVIIPEKLQFFFSLKSQYLIFKYSTVVWGTNECILIYGNTKNIKCVYFQCMHVFFHTLFLISHKVIIDAPWQLKISDH